MITQDVGLVIGGIILLLCVTTLCVFLVKTNDGEPRGMYATYRRRK